MTKSSIVKAMRGFLLRFIFLSAALIIISNISYFLMTWLMQDVIHVENRYLRSEFQFLGTVIIALSILVVVFVIMYRRRRHELTTLSDSIERVASGDYSGKIRYSERDSMAHVYKAFNKMSAELSSVQFLRQDFINNYSHEFKTPLASINGFASLMLEKELSKEEQIAYLKIIQEESDRLSRLTSNTILMGKLSSREIISKTETYDLGEQLRQCSVILSHEWLEKNQTFSGDFPQVLYNGNRELMQHLWINLIANAIKYTPPGGEITVILSCQEHTAVVSISDTGEGMDEETMAHLFEPYFQGSASRSHSHSGLGLGLSIARQIAELSEGEIKIKSAPGKGSTFTVRLPLKSCSASVLTHSTFR